MCLSFGCPRKRRNAVAGKQRKLKFLQPFLGNGATSRLVGETAIGTSIARRRQREIV